MTHSRGFRGDTDRQLWAGSDTPLDSKCERVESVEIAVECRRRRVVRPQARSVQFHTISSVRRWTIWITTFAGKASQWPIDSENRLTTRDLNQRVVTIRCRCVHDLERINGSSRVPIHALHHGRQPEPIGSYVQPVRLLLPLRSACGTGER